MIFQMFKNQKRCFLLLFFKNHEKFKDSILNINLFTKI